VFYSLKSGIYIDDDSHTTDAKVVVYDEAQVPVGWLFVLSGFISFASYVLIVLSANVRVINGVKVYVSTLNRLLKQKVSQKKSNG
jgi:hypothetical protein